MREHCNCELSPSAHSEPDKISLSIVSGVHQHAPLSSGNSDHIRTHSFCELFYIADKNVRFEIFVN